MENKMLMITVASWEERFVKGANQLLTQYNPKRLIMYFFEEYRDHTAANRSNLKQLCTRQSIELEEYELSFSDPSTNWTILYDTITRDEVEGRELIVDFTTMPREILWSLLDLLESYNAIIKYAYQTPERYSSVWLSRDPGRPRLVYKLAGEFRFGIQQALLILTGYDPERVDQLIRIFEPDVTILGIQTGEQFNNQSMNVDKYKQYSDDNTVRLFNLDAYSDDHGFAEIEKQLKPLLEGYNIIMSSLGPKLSAIALYRLHKKYTHTALAYAPSKEFNLDYSVGADKMFSGPLNV
jgi:hypothetical protein